MNQELMELVYDHDELADLDPAARRIALRALLADRGVADVGSVVRDLAEEIDGFGPLSRAMSTAGVTDVLVNGPDEIWIERDGTLQPTDARFADRQHLYAWCERIVSEAGGRIDASWPISDVRLVDGSRLHAVLPPVAPDGPIVSIRRSPGRPRTLEDLAGLGAMDDDDVERLRGFVAEGRSIAIGGATGTGKTTLLNALLLEVPPDQRVVTIEELPEIRAARAGVVSLVARSPNAEGRGGVGLDELVRASVRMRPDRIVIGEVRGPEALPALSAMATGHAGTMLSVHGRSAAHVTDRLVSLALSAPEAPSEDTLVRQVRSTLDVVVHLARAERRRVVEEIVCHR